ncbi:MAG: phosphotransferase [Candidatus Wildermuthbacteria bacterium]|nr:phosphotransferase [Candidatus Wildermuthbacteria bacterium]
MNKDLLYLKKLFSKPFRAKRAGGQTNRNYVVSFKARKLFVRLPWESVLDRTIEGKNILLLSRNQKVQRILPKYFIYVLSKRNILNIKDKNRYNVPDGTMVAEYIAGREFTVKDFRQKEYQRRLVKTLGVFHTSGVRLVNGYDVFRDEVAKYRVAVEKYPATKVVSRKILADIRKIEREAKKRLPLSKKGISTHNDFLLQNFLVGPKKRMCLLDFEYAGFNVRGGMLYDFGFFFADNLFRKPAITKKLFEEFLGVVEREYKRCFNRRQIYWCAVAALLVQVWWGILRYFSAPQKERAYFKQYVQKRVEGVLQLYSELKRKES